MSEIPSRPRAFWAILALGLAVRVGYGFSRAPLSSPASNPDGYAELASNFARTGALSKDGRPSALREPVYPVYLGLWFKAFGPTHGAVLAANAALTAAFFLGFFAIGRRIFGLETALAACAIAALYPPFVYYSALPLRETAMLAFSALGLWALIEARRRGSFAAFALAGAASALAPLVNTTLLPFFLALAPAALAWMERARLAWAARRGAVYAVALALIYALWPLRNWMCLHTWIAGSLGSSGGMNLYIYQVVPQEDGGTPRQAEILGKDPVAIAGQALDAVARDHWYWNAGAARIVARPRAYARLVAWRFFADTWRLWPRPRAYEHSYAALKAVSLLSDGWIIPLGFAGMALTGLSVPEAMWLYLFVFSTDLIYSLFLTMLRYRLSLMPWMILLAAEALRRLRYSRMGAHG